MKRKLTDKDVTGAAPGKRTDVYDSLCQGLVLRLTPGGVRTFAVTYRDGGANRRFTLGRFGDTVRLRDGSYVELTLATARRLCQEARARLRLGQPLVEAPPLPAPESVTVGVLVRRYIQARAARLKPTTTARYLKNAGHLGSLSAANAGTLRRGDIRAWRDETAQTRGPASADALLALVNGALAWGVTEELVPRNPAARLEPAHRPTSHRALSDEELVKVWNAGDRFARFLLLTGLRRTEAAYLTWSDLDGSTLTVPPTYRKTRLGSERPLVIPLPPLALDVLGDVGAAGERIFGHKRYHARAEEVRTASGVEFTFHDLRVTCATGLAKVGAAPHVVAKLLDHAPATVARAGLAPAVTAVYDRADRKEEVTAALIAWSERVRAVVQSRDPGKVMAFARAQR